ncbi:hypothetical protein [Lewinella sp. LCG006]|uniref:hypothetical protein n=1 Tax=Lewinella sp. LCG006 TaxID=3231911 RepID=UPI00345F2ED6
MSEIRTIIQIKGPFNKLINHDFGYTIQDISSSDSLIDADLVFIDLSDIAVPIEAFYDQRYQDQIDEEYRIKSKQVEAHLKSGKSIVAFVTGQAETYSVDEDEDGQVYMRINKVPLLPEGHQLTKLSNSGINIEPCSEVVEVALNKLDRPRLFKYEYTLRKNEVDIPLLKIRNSNEIVAGIKFFDKGRIYYLPKINDSLLESDQVEQMILADSIISFTKNLSRSLGRDVSETVPEWVEEIQILEEADIRKSIQEVESEILTLEYKLRNYNERLRVLTQFKSILSSTGDQLESAIEAIFTYLGLTISRGAEKNRVDFIISRNDKYIVCEVKGVRGTAQESFATQLEKWSSEFYDTQKTIPQGLLIVATHIQVPPNERNQIDFPDQMMRYVKMKDQACMTTLSLLEILKRYHAGDWSSQYIFDLLYDSIGLIEI